MNTLAKSSAATLVEYVMITSLIAFVVLVITVSMQPGAETFHNEMGSGLINPYPKSFITPPPSP